MNPLPQSQATKRARVICLHGFPGHPSDWDQLAEDVGHNYDVISLPMPWLKSVNAASLSLRQFFSYCAIMIEDHADGETHLVGHDLGGLALWWLAQSELKNRMSSVAILSCPHPKAYRRFARSADYASSTTYIEDIHHNPAGLKQRLHVNEPLLGAGIAATLDQTSFDSLRPLYTEITQTSGSSDVELASISDLPLALISSCNDRSIGTQSMSDTLNLCDSGTHNLVLEGTSHFPHMSHTDKVTPFLKAFWNGVRHQ
jgi:pimeloyl-ACP methyl ester carboxylesterase